MSLTKLLMLGMPITSTNIYLDQDLIDGRQVLRNIKRGNKVNWSSNNQDRSLDVKPYRKCGVEATTRNVRLS